tara:strand:- start:8040 stop:8237 length:198 start_codon:yes stop_codon:yes gene_type:complete
LKNLGGFNVEYFFITVIVAAGALGVYELLEGILAGKYLDGDDEEIIAPIGLLGLLMFMVFLSYCG